MKLLFYLGHPAHFHLFKNVIYALKSKNHTVSVLLKKKDILENLFSRSNLEYLNILPRGRKDGKVGIALGMLKREWAMFRFCVKQRPDMLIGTSAEIAHVGKLLGIRSIIVNEDDYDAVPMFSRLGYPLAANILAPLCCPTGTDGSNWEGKTIHYEGYHELAYLHPAKFRPDRNLISDRIDFSKPYVIIRFAKLNAHHDVGKTGITTKIAKRIIGFLEDDFTIYITSERELEPEFEPYRIAIDPIYMHHALCYADLCLGDSQTMAAEAAVLGTPSIRFSDFVGKIGYLEELEHKYGLTYGIKTSEPEKLYQTLRKLISMPNLKEEWQKRQKKMLADKIDVTKFMIWFFENYPASVTTLKNNPEYQLKFK